MSKSLLVNSNQIIRLSRVSALSVADGIYSVLVDGEWFEIGEGPINNVGVLASLLEAAERHESELVTWNELVRNIPPQLAEAYKEIKSGLDDLDNRLDRLEN